MPKKTTHPIKPVQDEFAIEYHVIKSNQKKQKEIDRLGGVSRQLHKINTPTEAQLSEMIEIVNTKDSYVVDSGTDKGLEISGEKVRADLCRHFSVEPGISKEYSQAILRKLSKKDVVLLRELQQNNLALKADFDRAVIAADKDLIYELGYKKAEATLQFMHFLIRKKIPVIMEVTSEIAVKNDIKTYSGGLGVLAGDKHKEYADQEVPEVTVAIGSENGYGAQKINFISVAQYALPDEWSIRRHPEIFMLSNRNMALLGDTRKWKKNEIDAPFEIVVPASQEKQHYFGEIKANIMVYGHVGKTGWINPILYFNTTRVSKSYQGKNVTEQLYPDGDLKLASQYSLACISEYFMNIFKVPLVNLNEGHAALLPVILMRKKLENAGVNVRDESKINEIVKRNFKKIEKALNEVRSITSFVTHTIDSSAFDTYEEEAHVRRVLNQTDLNVIFMLNNPFLKNKPGFQNFRGFRCLRVVQGMHGEYEMHGISMADLAAFMASSINSVAEIHYNITSEDVFPEEKFKLSNVTNAIHSDTWWGPASEVQRIMESVVGNSAEDYMNGFKFLQLKGHKIFRDLIASYQLAAKAEIIPYINELILENGFRSSNLIRVSSDDDVANVLTAVFARRAKGYKQNALMVSNSVVQEFVKIAETLKETNKRIVIVMAGKAHARDMEARGFVDKILHRSKVIAELTDHKVMIVYKQNYDMADGEKFSKFDLSIANPVVGWEASGTSPMKGPLRLIMHTYDGFFAEYKHLANEYFGISDPSFGFGPTEKQKHYFGGGTEQIYADALKDKMSEAVDVFYNNKDLWLDKQIEQYAMFTMGFQMQRFLDNYLTLWKDKVPNFKKFYEMIH
nr:glycogen/starch/alpha-glucan phosphorylase [Desulfobulbaceae bacterium]